MTNDFPELSLSEKEHLPMENMDSPEGQIDKLKEQLKLKTEENHMQAVELKNMTQKVSELKHALAEAEDMITTLKASIAKQNRELFDLRQEDRAEEMARKKVRSHQNFHPSPTHDHSHELPPSSNPTSSNSIPPSSSSTSSSASFSSTTNTAAPANTYPNGNNDSSGNRRTSSRLESRSSRHSVGHQSDNGITSPPVSSKSTTPEGRMSTRSHLTGSQSNSNGNAHGASRRSSDKNRGHYAVWSPEEDEALLESVKKYGTKIWSRVAMAVPTRTIVQCQNRFHGHLKKLEPSLFTRDFKGYAQDDEEDNALMREAAKGSRKSHSSSSSSSLPSLPSKRTDMGDGDSRHSYREEAPITAPASPINTAPWTPEEDQYLVATVRDLDGTHSHMWTWLGKLMSRDSQDCQRRYDELTEIWGVKEWKPEEDRILKASVAVHGQHQWQYVARDVMTKTSLQCKERWLELRSLEMEEAHASHPVSTIENIPPSETETKTDMGASTNLSIAFPEENQRKSEQALEDSGKSQESNFEELNTSTTPVPAVAMIHTPNF